MSPGSAACRTMVVRRRRHNASGQCWSDDADCHKGRKRSEKRASCHRLTSDGKTLFFNVYNSDVA